MADIPLQEIAQNRSLGRITPPGYLQISNVAERHLPTLVEASVNKKIQDRHKIEINRIEESGA